METRWTIFESITAYFFRPKIDLLASRLNYQVPRYVAWHPDPGAEAVDAFTLDWHSDTFFAFPPFSLLGRVVQNIEDNRAEGILVAPNWPTQPWYPGLMRLLVHETKVAAKGKTSAEIALQPRSHSSPAFKVSTPGLSLVRESLCEKGLREKTLEIIMASWRDSTQKQYAGYLQKWQRFCSGQKVDTLLPPVEEVLHFLTELLEANCGYSALNTARSALSTFIVLPGNISVGNHPLVTRFMKGVFQSRPTFPKYAEIWDANAVLSYLKTLSPVAKLSLKYLTYKVTMMLMLLSGQRIQTSQLLKSQFMFKVLSKVKHTKPGRHLQDLKFKAYAPDRMLCIYTCLQKYLAVMKPLRGDETKLLISFNKPYQGVSRDTIRRWIKQVLSNSGVDTNL